MSETATGNEPTTAVAATPPAKSILPSIRKSFTPEQVELIKRTICPKSSDDELQLFLYTATRSGLDPLARQIYAVFRWSAKEGRNVMAIQVGIDGFRLTAQRTKQHAGTDDVVYVESGGATYPVSASVTVYKVIDGHRTPFTATARWAEYSQRDKGGDITSMWKKMPYLMLGKCAEALALRKAFPAELSGLYTDDEMAQADNAIPAPAAIGAPTGTAPTTPTEDNPIRIEIGAWLLEMNGQSKDASAAQLKELTTFTAGPKSKDPGKVVAGVSSLKDLRGMRLTIAHRNIKKVYDEWKQLEPKSGAEREPGDDPVTV